LILEVSSASGSVGGLRDELVSSFFSSVKSNFWIRSRHTLESSNDLRGQLLPLMEDQTDLSDKLSRDTVRLDLAHQLSLSPFLSLVSKERRRERTMTKDLSLTVPFSPAIVLGPSIIKGDLIAIISPIHTWPKRRRTLISSPSSNSSTGKNTSANPGSRPSGNGREGPHFPLAPH
jgi:hypothetical protein